MKPPYWQCDACETIIGPASLPVTKDTTVPVCPKCLSWEAVDMVIGDSEDLIDDEMVLVDTGDEA